MAHPFNELEQEYKSWVANVHVNPSRAAEVDSVARRLIKPYYLDQYQAVLDRIGVPVVVQATICEREDSNDFSKNPAQGDPWNARSVHDPKGRGPFPSWVEAAIDAFHECDHLDDNSAPWSLPYACWKWEAYNGFGYRARGLRTPYVVGGTNLQQPGKFTADDKFDFQETDVQIGCLPIAMRMIELMPSLSLGDAIAQASNVVIPTPAQPPAGVGGSLTGARWIQSTLNLVLALDPPLIIDGSYGKQTRAAVRLAQATFGMPQTGIVDSALCTALDARLAAMRPNP